MTKTCTKCNKNKSIKEFSKKSNTKDGLNNRCKLCCKVIHKEYLQTNKGKKVLAKAVKKYKRTSKGKISQYKFHNRWGKGVYGIFEKGKCLYVGESKTLSRRIYEHKHLLSHISNELKSHSEWFIGILEQCDNHKEKEQYYINKLKPLYNGRM